MKMRTKPFSIKPLTILQTNISKAATSHEIALSLAADSLTDVILIQEPYVFTDLSRRIIKSHSLYKSFIPVDD